ncbi:hypothetical protein Tco_1441037, partial [Tanacetum coccineum]
SKNHKVYNWETATYDKIWCDEDVRDIRSIETEFPAIVYNDAFTSEVTLSCEPTVSPLNDNKIDFRKSFKESDDDDYTCLSEDNPECIFNFLTESVYMATVDTAYSLNEYNVFDTDINMAYPGVWIRRPHCKEIDEVGEVSIIWNPICDCSHDGIQTHLQPTSLLTNSTWRIYQAKYPGSFSI